MQPMNEKSRIRQLHTTQPQINDQFYSQLVYFIQNCPQFILRKQSKHIASKIICLLEQYSSQSESDSPHKGKLTFLLKQIKIRLDKMYKSQQKVPFFCFLLTEARKLNFHSLNQIKVQGKKFRHNFKFSPFIQSSFEKNFYVRTSLFDCRALQEPTKEKQFLNILEKSFSQCPNCISQFFFNQIVNPTAFTMKNVIFLERKEKLDYQNFVQWICAIANSGGGVIFVGIDPTSYIVEGVHFTEDQFEEYKKELKKKTKKIHPQQVIITSNLVPIVKSPFAMERVNDNLCILRIFVKPKCGRKLYYYEKQRKPFLPDNNTFLLDEKKEKFLLVAEEVYNFLQKKYFHPIPYKSVHWNSDCQKSEPYKFSSTLSEEQAEEENLNFKFKHQSMVIYGKGRQKKFQAFLQKMEEKLFKYSKQQPFIDLQVNHGHIYWLISHEAPVNDVLSLIPKKQKTKISLFNVKKGVECLQPIKEKLLNMFEVHFEKRFNGEKIRKKTCGERKDERLFAVKISLKTLQQAIFTYIFINVHGCRCAFDEPEDDKKGKEFK